VYRTLAKRFPRPPTLSGLYSVGERPVTLREGVLSVTGRLIAGRNAR
jgi:hypothetical protein